MEERKQPRYRKSFSRDYGIGQHIDELLDFKIWERFDKPKEEKQSFTLKQKILIMHYVGLLEVFKKGVDRNNILSVLLDLNIQTAKEYSGNINDFEEMKTSKNLSIILKYFQAIKLNSAINLVNVDIKKIGNRLKNRKL